MIIIFNYTNILEDLNSKITSLLSTIGIYSLFIKNNISKINIWDTHYTPPEVHETQADNSFIQSFIGKLRKKFGF